MSSSHAIRFCAALVLLFALDARAETRFPEPNWTLSQARHAAAQVDTIAAVRPLFDLARAGQDQDLQRALVALAERADWPEPARERVLHTFALGLADLPPGMVSRDVMEWLLSYQPRTLVPHDDHPLVGVPLYGIGTAAAGARHAWERQAAVSEADRLLQRGVDAWLDAWLSASPARQRGFMDALDGADADQLRALAGQALERLPAEPALTAVAARAGVRLSDPAIVQQAVAAGGGPGLAPALRSAARSFDEIERADLLVHAIREAPAVNASLAIAELAPGLLHQPGVTELLFVRIGDQALGPAAALALAKSKSPSVQERLEELAGSGTGLQALRAAIAVETARQNAGGTRQ